MHRYVVLGLLLLLPTLARAVPADWGACMPLAAGSCATVSDLRVTGTLDSTGGAVTCGTGACTIGQATTDSITFTTDGTGNGEIVLPAQAVSATEIVNDTIDGAQLADSIAMDAAMTIGTGNFALTMGDSTTDTFTVTTDGTGNGEVVLPAESVAAAEITNLTRSIPLPLDSWVNCTTPAALDFSSGADDDPDIIVSTGVISITYDDTGGSIDADEICTTFTVPADYASGGSFVARMTQDGATVTQVETFSCRISVDGAAVGAANAGNAANQTAVQSVTSTPAGTWAAGASIAVSCKQGNASADDAVLLHAIEAQYTATQ